jgi:hypothetical protein
MLTGAGSDVCEGIDQTWCENRLFLSNSYRKTIIFPRQARDNIGKLEKREAFVAGTELAFDYGNAFQKRGDQTFV